LFVFHPVVMVFFGDVLFLALWRVVQQDRSRAAFWLLFLPLMNAAISHVRADADPGG